MGIRGAVIASSRRPEFAFLRIPGDFFHPVPVWVPPEPGREVILVGFPGNRGLTVNRDFVAGYTEVHGIEMRRTTAAIRHGASGGAVLDTFDRLVGIAVGFNPDQFAGNYAISGEEMLAYARREGLISRADYQDLRERFQFVREIRQRLDEAEPSAPEYRPGLALSGALGPAVVVFALVFGVGRLWMAPKRPPYSFTVSFLFVWIATAAGILLARPGDPPAAPPEALFWPAIRAALLAVFYVGSRTGEDSAISGNPRRMVGESSTPEDQDQEEQAEEEPRTLHPPDRARAKHAWMTRRARVKPPGSRGVAAWSGRIPAVPGTGPNRGVRLVQVLSEQYHDQRCHWL